VTFAELPTVYTVADSLGSPIIDTYIGGSGAAMSTVPIPVGNNDYTVDAVMTRDGLNDASGVYKADITLTFTGV
jgi:hypothetical protein